MVENTSSSDGTYGDKMENEGRGGIGTPLPHLDVALERAIESVLKGEKKSIILWGDRYSGKTLAVLRFTKLHGDFSLEHIQMPKEPFNEADAQRYMNQLREGIVLEGSYHQICYLFSGCSLTNRSDKTKKWLERLEDGVRKKLATKNSDQSIVPDDFEEVWASFTRADAEALFNHYARKVEIEHPGIQKYSRAILEKGHNSFILMASWGNPWEGDQTHRGRLIPSLLEANMVKYAGKDDDDLERTMKGLKKNELLIASFFGFTVLDASIQGVNLLGLVKETASVLASAAPFLPLAGVAILGTSSLLGFVKAGKENGIAKYVSVHASWIDLPDQKRRILCEKLDEKNELPPGSSYAFLNDWLCGRSSSINDVDAFRSKLETIFTDAFIATIQRTIDESQEVKSKLEELNDRIEDIEASIKMLNSEVRSIKTVLSAHDNEFQILYRQIDAQNRELDALRKMVQSMQGNWSINLDEKSYANLISQSLGSNKKQKFEETLEEHGIKTGLDPTNADYQGSKGIALKNLSKFDEAIKEFDEAIRLDPANNSESHFNKGTVLGLAAKFDEAIKEFDEAIRLDPTNAEYHSNKGMLLLNLSRYEEAIIEMDEAIRLNPDSLTDHINKNTALGLMSRYDESIIEIDEAIRLSPNTSFYHMLKALTLNVLARNVEASKEFDEAIRLDPDNSDAYFGRGLMLHGLSRYDEAIKDFDEAIRLKPDNHTYHYNRYVILVNQYPHTRPAEALKEADELVRLDSDSSNSYLSRATALYYLHRYDEAINEFDVAIKLKPNDPLNHFVKGEVLVFLSRFDEAIREFDIAITLDPKNTKYRRTRDSALESKRAQRPWRRLFNR